MQSQEMRTPTEGQSVSVQSEVSGQASFSTIIALFAEKAKANGLDAGRVDRAVELVLHPDDHRPYWVWSKADPLTLNVRSQSDPERWYRVNGQCECVDYQQHGNWCKHRIARALIIRAEELLLSLADAPLSTLPSWRDVPPRRQVRL